MDQAKSTWKDFRDFALRGNVLDLAVGVVIGGAFSQIITALVNFIILPLVGLLVGRVDLSQLSVTLNPTGIAAGSGPLILYYGNFLQSILDFLMIALCIFFAMRLIGRFRRKQAEAAPPPTPRSEALLMEIRDLLKEQNTK